ncbi:MAG: DUF4366 domain-containing protein [Lachnospiraceae bacterium]|nr:DUF4366 domain-containing protein [Lachnospiraceae bacterium]
MVSLQGASFASEGKEVEHWGPLTPEGNMDLVDDYRTLEAGGKQFITVVTKYGNYFYIIIDRDDQGTETVHFLNMVDEADLLSLMDEEQVEEYMAATTPVEEEKEEVKEETTETIEAEEPAEEPVEKEKGKKVNGIRAIIFVCALAGIGGFMYFKSSKGKKNKPSGPDPDADYFDDDEEYYDDLDEIEDELNNIETAEK